MDYKVILSPLALEDFEQIIQYVAAKDPDAAMRLGTRLLDQAGTLRSLPHRGGKVRRRSGVRKVLHRPYIIFYRVDEESHSVTVLRFWHGARDQRDLELS